MTETTVFSVPPLEICSLLNRTYLLYGQMLPLEYEDHKLPVLLAFHGGGQTPDEFIHQTGLNEISALVIAPSGQRSFNGHTWENAFAWLFDNHQSDIQFLKAIVENIPDIFHGVAIHRDRLYATGLSDGAGFAVYITTHFLDIIPIQAVAVCSGAFFFLDSSFSVNPSSSFYSLRVNPTIPFMVIKDPVMPYAGHTFYNPKAIAHCKQGFWHQVDLSCQHTVTANILEFCTRWAQNQFLSITFLQEMFDCINGWKQ